MEAALVGLCHPVAEPRRSYRRHDGVHRKQASLDDVRALRSGIARAIRLAAKEAVFNREVARGRRAPLRVKTGASA